MLPRSWHLGSWRSRTFGADLRKALPSTKLILRIRVPSQFFVRFGELHQQPVLSFSCNCQTPLKMIRNALRQSVRTVGPVSVRSQLVVVSFERTITPMPATQSYVILSVEVSFAVQSSRAIVCIAQWVEMQKTDHLNLHRTDAWLQQRSKQRRDKSEAMRQKRKPRRPKSLRSWSRGSEVFRRKPVLPRLVACCPLGAWGSLE